MFSKLCFLAAAIHSLLVSANSTPAALAPRNYGPGNAILVNRCPYDIWFEHVNGPIVSEKVFVSKRSLHVRPLEFPSGPGCGTVLKVSKTEDIIDGHHTQFEYAIDVPQNMIYYDVSYVNCAVDKRDASNCPGHERGHAIDSANQQCGKVGCSGGSFCPTQAYYVPIPDQDPDINLPQPVFGCGDQGYGMDITFKMCSDEAPVAKRGIAGRISLGDA